MPLVSLLVLLAQAPHSGATFKSSADLAVIHVSVVDKHAGFVSGLPRDAFAVYEDGRPQPIALFENDDTPVSVGLVIDSSQSMSARRDAVIAASIAFAESSHPDDEIFTLNFNERIWPGLPEGQAFTSDRAELHKALNRSGSRGKTALFDAIHQGLVHLDGGGKPRRVLIVVSDGGDNASHAKLDEVVKGVHESDATVYSVAIVDPLVPDGSNPRLLQRLAKSTGGEFYFPRRVEEVPRAFERIAKDIRSAYTIAYIPTKNGDSAADRRRRTVKVYVHSNDGRVLTVRARDGYFEKSSEAPQ
jgi:Ca-activated chloride channel family protein